MADRKSKISAPIKRGRGRPKHIPTSESRNLVASMVAQGLKQDSIMRHVGLRSKVALYRHYRSELDTSLELANTTIGNVLYQKAKAGEAWAVRFWLERRAESFKPVQVIENVGKDGAPIAHQIDLSLLSTDQLVALAPLLEVLAGKSEPPKES